MNYSINIYIYMSTNPFIKNITLLENKSKKIKKKKINYK